MAVVSCGTVTIQTPDSTDGDTSDGDTSDGRRDTGTDNGGSTGGDSSGGRRDTGSENNDSNDDAPLTVPVIGRLEPDNPRLLAVAGGAVGLALLSARG